MVPCLGGPPGGFCVVDTCCCCCCFQYWSFYVSRVLIHVTSTPPWLLRPVKASTSSKLYPGYFRLLYFCQAFPSQIYRERYGFEWAFFYPQAFFTLRSLSNIFGTFCDSDVGRNTPSSILLYACSVRVVPSGWRMDFNCSYCSYKTIDLLIALVSHEI